MGNPTVFILSGPAGVGKTTLWHEIESTTPHIEKVITTTSRGARAGEVDGQHYYFISRKEFEDTIHAGGFIEYAVVHTNYYGSTDAELARIISDEKSPLYIIEPQGMVHLKPLLESRGYTVVTVFLLPPSLDELKARLHQRGTETTEQFEIRLATAMHELEQQEFYDIRLVNDELEKTKMELRTLLSM